MLNSKSPGRGRFAPSKFFLGLAILASSLQSAYAAQSESTVNLNYRYTLTDLAPLDNVAPSLTLFSSFRYTYYMTNYQYHEQSDDNNFSPLSSNLTLGADLVASSITGAPYAGGETLSAHSFSTTADGYGEYEDAYHESGAGRSFQGMLSANTAITFDFDFSLDATGLSPADTDTGARLDFRAYHGDTWPRTPDFLLFNYAERFSGDGTRNVSGSYTFENRNSSAELIGSETVMTAWSVAPNVDPSPIPEPAAYVMFATGLALLGARKRRRTNQIG